MTAVRAGNLSLPPAMSTARETAAPRRVGRMRQIRWAIPDLPRIPALCVGARVRALAREICQEHKGTWTINDALACADAPGQVRRAGTTSELR